MFTSRQEHDLSAITSVLALSLLPPSAMSKRGSDSTRRGSLKVKKRKGIRTQAILVPDSDDESLPPNVTTDYARLVKTRVDLSGKVGALTATSIRLLEVDNAPKDPPPEFVVDDPVDAAPEAIVPIISTTQRKRKKANDSVSLAQLFLFSF